MPITKTPHIDVEYEDRGAPSGQPVILLHGGTLIGFLGDGIVAVFGAPIEQPDHADRAVAAAREMTCDALDMFNGWLREAEIADGFRMGVGLNSGEVMAGNVGSERRLEYTVIGDVVNTASRLEAITKHMPHMILMADSTRTMLTSEVRGLVETPVLEVPGRRARVR